MLALEFQQVKQPCQWVERANLVPGPGEVVVSLHAAALNRRDYWITQGMYPNIRTPVILGSDGAGVVSALGDGVDAHWADREVIINPGWHWGTGSAAHGSQFKILGMPDDGTFATEVKVPQEYLHPKPEYLTWPEAAALPLAGVTAYRALMTQGRILPQNKVLITGIGGGVAAFALQYAVATGASVFVTSSSPDKIAQARSLGAQSGFLYTDSEWVQQARQQAQEFDLIIDSAGGDGYAALLELAAPGGRIVNYGATAGPPKKLDLFKVFWKQLHLIGSTMGSPDDFAAMLEFVQGHQLRPLVDDVLPLPDGNQALERMRDSPQFGKLVLRVR